MTSNAEVRRALADPDSRWLSITEAAHRLKLSEAQIHQRTKNGQLVSERLLGRRLVLEQSVVALERIGNTMAR